MPTGLTGSCPSTMDCSNYFCVSSAMTKNWKKVNEDAYEALSECSTYFPLLNHGCGSDTCYLEADKFYTESIEGGTILDGGALDANSNFPPGFAVLRGSSVRESVLSTCFTSSSDSPSFVLLSYWGLRSSQQYSLASLIIVLVRNTPKHDSNLQGLYITCVLRAPLAFGVDPCRCSGLMLVNPTH